MLSLAPPYYIYQGVPVLADAQDPRQFHYLPNRPHFAVDEQNRPAVRFIALKDDPNAPATDDQVTGFFFFDTSIDWPAETLTSVARKIQADHNLDQVPRLVPLLYRKGTVRLMFLDQMTPDPNAPPGSSDGSSSGTATGDGTGPVTPSEKWVTLLESSGVPSLYGENRAIFSAVLTKKATQLLYGAFDGFVPAGVVYDLTFDGLQPAFHIHIDVDWRQVYTFLKEKYAVDLLFFSNDVENIAQKLEEAKIIHFDAAIMGVGDEGLQGQFNDAKKQLTDFVLDNFFKPVPNPNRPDTSVQDGVISVIQAIRDLGSPVNVGYQRIDLTDDELRTLNIDYDIAVAVERHIAPQGHLSMFFSDYNLKRDDVVTIVDTADSVFRTADFQVVVSAPFSDDAIDAVTVDVAYGQPSPPPANAGLWSFLFRDGNVQKRSGWYDPSVGDQVQYRYETVFHPAPTAGPSSSSTVVGSLPRAASSWLRPTSCTCAAPSRCRSMTASRSTCTHRFRSSCATAIRCRVGRTRTVPCSTRATARGHRRSVSTATGAPTPRSSSPFSTRPATSRRTGSPPTRIASTSSTCART